MQERQDRRRARSRVASELHCFRVHLLILPWVLINTNAIKNFKLLAHAVSPQANATAEGKAASKTESLLGVELSDGSIRRCPISFTFFR
ncbi:hypothetical protein BDP27DRAFT_1448584 [Rhodocollybia butyracea]|uniref:Uncharacterized protein n=1 Tax=Rhodocollybia butyracea TaxID=206335 RepID=A0A9P5PLV0_9AGAR|nr:hypothetical protein BDP27DRAFT_1448584 [Rhodocollybia butyracea]